MSMSSGSSPLDPAVPPPPGAHALTAQVDLGQLARNLAGLRRVSKELGLLAVVKADAYGHGMGPVAGALEAAGIDGFCVATLQEALQLRADGIRGSILVFEGVGHEALPLAAVQHLDLTVVSADHLRELAPAVALHPVNLHLKVDTGMGRSGLLLEDLGACLDLLRPLRDQLQGVMSQFADSEEPEATFIRIQRERFQGAVAQLRDAGLPTPMLHQGNSGACLRGFVAGDTHARCGIALYGLSEVPEARAAGLRPILELTAEVIRAVRVPAGTTVGYSSTYTAPEALTLVTVNCGYADGYFRALANRAVAGYQGHTYPVVGRISMDMLTVAMPEATVIGPRDRVTLLSRNPEDPHSVQNTARLLAGISYEVTCALNRRVLRQPF